MCSTAMEKHTQEIIHILDVDKETEKEKGHYECTSCGGKLIPKLPTGAGDRKLESQDARIFSVTKYKEAIEYAVNNKKEKKEKWSSSEFTPHFAHSPEERDIWALCPEANDNSDRNLDFAYKHICDLNSDGKYIISKHKDNDWNPMLEYIKITTKTGDKSVFITTQRPSRYDYEFSNVITIRKWKKWKGYGLVRSNKSIGAIWVNNEDHKKVAYSYKRQKRNLKSNGYVLEFCLQQRGFIITAPDKTIVGESETYVKCDYVTSYVTLDQVMSRDKIDFPPEVKAMHPDDVKRLTSQIEHNLQTANETLQYLLGDKQRLMETLEDCIQMIEREKYEINLDFQMKSDRSESPSHQVMIDLQKAINDKHTKMIENWKENEELNKMLGIQPTDSFVPGEKNQLAIEISKLQTELNHLNRGETIHIRHLKRERDSAIQDADERIKHLRAKTDEDVEKINNKIKQQKENITWYQNELRELEQ